MQQKTEVNYLHHPILHTVQCFEVIKVVFWLEKPRTVVTHCKKKLSVFHLYFLNGMSYLKYSNGSTATSA